MNDDPSDPPIRVMALHALAYCERLFYLEEVEEIRVADERVYAGRTLHEDLKHAEEEGGEWSSLEMSSEELGLTGKVDCLRRRDDGLIPYEHKRGRARRDGKRPTAWPSDAIQVNAYGMLLEEHTHQAVPEGRIRYHADNVTVRVPLDEETRNTVRNAVSRARELRDSPNRPPVTGNDRLCIKCSLAPVCLPEEERLAADPKWDAIRLFPADRERKTIHVIEHGAHVGKTGDGLKIETGQGEPQVFPIRDVGAVVLHGYPQMSTQALHLCAWNEVSVHWLSAGGRYVTGTATATGQVQRRIRQYQALADESRCLMLARKVAMAKVEGALRYVLRSTQGIDRQSAGVSDAVQTIRTVLKAMAHAESLDEVRGHEGMAGKAYFSTFPVLLRDGTPPDLAYVRRSRRPPRDRFNTLLGFGYALLYQAVLQAVVATGLEPALGFFHQPRSSAHPLVLDLMELFRVPIWDMPMIGSVNRQQWDCQEDFEVTQTRVWLSNAGRKKAIKLFEDRLEEKWKHPVVKYSLSYARLIELEVRLLEKEWSGQPGLFAKMRIR